MIEWYIDNQITLLLILIGLTVFYCLIPLIDNAVMEQRSRRRILKTLSLTDISLLSDITVSLNNNATTQIDHVLITRFGIFVIEEKNYIGILQGGIADIVWHKVNRRHSHTLQNPFKQNIAHIHGLQRTLKTGDIPMFNVVLINGRCSYNGTPPNGLCMGVTNLANYVHQHEKLLLTAGDVKHLTKVILREALPKTILTDLGHRISISRKYHVRVPMNVLVTYNAALAVTMLWRGFLKLFQTSGVNSPYHKYRKK